MFQANNAFVDSTLQLLGQYKKDLKNHFGSEFQEVSYSLPEEAAQIINAWIDQNTRGKIKEFIDPESIDPLVRMMLVNAIYFKGKQITEFTFHVIFLGAWKVPFLKEATHKNAPFFTLNGEEKGVEQMNLQGDLQYAEFKTLQARAVRLAFEQLVLDKLSRNYLATKCW